MADIDVYDLAHYVGDPRAEQLLPGAHRLGARTPPALPPPGDTWWDCAANFHKGLGMRIDHLLVTGALAERATGAEVDRDARKGKLPSDHAPLYLDLA
jgi:endonuclease/exonuclease/phosphatase family metal-dependent hydrolase